MSSFKKPLGMTIVTEKIKDDLHEAFGEQKTILILDDEYFVAQISHQTYENYTEYTYKLIRILRL